MSQYILHFSVFVCASVTTEKEKSFEVEALKEMGEEYSDIRLVKMGHCN